MTVFARRDLQCGSGSNFLFYCHMYEKGISYCVRTEPVIEPTIMSSSLFTPQKITVLNSLFSYRFVKPIHAVFIIVSYVCLRLFPASRGEASPVGVGRGGVKKYRKCRLGTEIISAYSFSHVDGRWKCLKQKRKKEKSSAIFALCRHVQNAD